MASRQSRYQEGLSYDPGMSTGRYRPEVSSATMPQTSIGDYTGITGPSLEGEDGFGVVAPQSDGGGLGGAGSLGGGALLSLLSNPTVLRFLGEQLGLTGTPAGTQVGAASTGTSAPAGGQQTAQAASGAAGGLPTVVYGGPDFGFVPGASNPFGGDLIQAPQGFDLGVGPAGQYQGWQQPIAPEGGAGVPADDGGLLGDLGGSILGDTGLAGTAYQLPADASVLDGVVGSGLMGGGFDLLGGLATMGAGALGNYVAGEAEYYGDRDPLGSQIGAGLGSLAGGMLLGPVGAFLGSQFGGMIGGQFGPQQSVGSNWSTNYYASPEGWVQGGTGQDNGGTANPSFAARYNTDLQALAAQRGYVLNPAPTGQGYAVGHWGVGNLFDAPGYFYTPTQDGMGGNPQAMFNSNLSAPYQSGYLFNPTISGWDGGNAYEAMVGYGLDQLLASGLYGTPGSWGAPQTSGGSQPMAPAPSFYDSGNTA